MANAELLAMAEELADIRDRKEKLEADLKYTNELETELQRKFVAAMELANIQSFDHKLLGKFYLESRVFPKVKDLELLKSWMTEHGVPTEGIIKEQIHASTLRGWYNERLKDGQDVPGDTAIEVYSDQRVKFMGAKPKGGI